MIDIESQKFGRLKVISYVGGSKWLCQCDCKITKVVDGRSLRSGETKSCGCLRKENKGARTKHNIGDRIGNLVILDRVGKNWELVCDCGRKVTLSSQILSRRAFLNMHCGSLVHPSKNLKLTPETPSPIPQAVGDLFKKYEHRLIKFKSIGCAEDIAKDALIRACYILFWRSEQGFAVTKESEYIYATLRSTLNKYYNMKKLETDGGSCDNINTSKPIYNSIGKIVTNSTLFDKDEAKGLLHPDFMTSSHKRLKFKRC